MYGCTRSLQKLTGFARPEAVDSHDEGTSVYEGRIWSSTSLAYISPPRAICLVLLRHAAPLACSLACANTGNRMAAKIAMIAMTTKSSIRVNAVFLRAFMINCGLRRPVADGLDGCQRTKSGCKFGMSYLLPGEFGSRT